MQSIVKKNRFWLNVKWQIVGSIVQALLGGILLLLTGKQLGAAGFGILSIVLGYVAVVNLLVEPRIHDVAAKQFCDLNCETNFLAFQNQYFIDFFIVEVSCKFLTFVSLIVLTPLIIKIGNLPSDSLLLIVVAATGTFLSKLGSGLSVGLLRVLGRMELNVYCSTAELVSRLVLTLALIEYETFNVLSCLIVLFLTGIASNSIQWLLLAKRIEGIGLALQIWKSSEAVQRLRENQKLLVANVGISAADLMNKDLDVTLMATLMPPDQIGVYKMSKNIAMLTWRAVDPFNLSIMPEMSSLVATKNYLRLQNFIRRICCGLFGLALCACVASYTFISFFGNNLLGTSFSPVNELLPWMYLGIIIGASLIWSHPLAVALNRADISFKASLFGSVIGLGTFWSLTAVYGVIGSSIAWSLTLLLTFTFTAILSINLLTNQMRQK